DMAGNVREWVDDALPADAGEEPWRSSVDPRGPAEGAAYVVRGGGYLSAPFELRVSYRWAEPGERFAADLGFRCAYRARP
ncbi:MAG: formylglycine-generating enzyme family protein, partial [Deltaproteobacteria bacterium]|nr:formylglycine-generating enzyme family protein [Deltaproteobacteria bacterium]